MDPQLIDAGLWYIVFLFSTVFHEASHAFLAMKLGDLTAYKGGQVSLNPIPHIKREPFGTVIVPIMSFYTAGWMIGWASTPLDPKWSFQYPRKSAAVSAGGPISNFILLVFSAIIIRAGILFNFFAAPESINLSNIVEPVVPGAFTIFAKLISIIFSLNLILLTFNLIPLPPLDGSGIIPLWLNDDHGRKYMKFIRKPFFSLVGIFIAWRFFGPIYFKIHLFCINLLYPGSNYH
jgi:Zn-dependent protease